ncbi:hypothetical protein SESBI_06258 [Sesbania bispinosa]|nr:hypothetical protein SESBI_06258 [Sesbania bispinosa]
MWKAASHDENMDLSVMQYGISLLAFRAFCNPADVEAFTEEKKHSLVKRQGKGADFARAVKEIIESYEKFKRETQLDETSSGDEVSNANVSNPLDQSVNIGLKDQIDAPLTINSQMKSSNSVIDRSELVCAAEDDSAVALRDESYDREASLEEPTDNAVGSCNCKITFASKNREMHQFKGLEAYHRSKTLLYLVVMVEIMRAAYQLMQFRICL